MAIQRRNCKNHPDRAAIGVCVITGEAICSECSTRYEGVNYSKEGLRILQERRRAKGFGGMLTALQWMLVLVSPLVVLTIYGSYKLVVEMVIEVLHSG